MAHRSLENLRMDRRLIGRAGWMDKEALEKELEALPDLSAKVAPPEEAPAAGTPGAPRDAGDTGGSG